MKYILFFTFSSILLQPGLFYFSRYRAEMSFIHCQCTVSPEYREWKIHCMDSYVPTESQFRLTQSIQYCGNLAISTNFGDTVRKGQNIYNYDPWRQSASKMMNNICGLTRIKPNEPLAMPLRKAVTPSVWVISKCILNMAKITNQGAQHMLQACCY